MAMMKVQGSWNQLPMWAEQLRQRYTVACGSVHWSSVTVRGTVLSHM